MEKWAGKINPKIPQHLILNHIDTFILPGETLPSMAVL